MAFSATVALLWIIVAASVPTAIAYRSVGVVVGSSVLVVIAAGGLASPGAFTISWVSGLLYMLHMTMIAPASGDEDASESSNPR